MARKKEGAKVSINKAAQLLGYDRSTITKWITEEGCPVASADKKGTKTEYILDLRSITDWLQDRAAKAATKDMPSVDGIPDADTSEARHKHYKAEMAAIELDELRREVVRISDVAEKVLEEYAELRTILLQMSGSVAPHLESLGAAQIKDKLDREVNRTLRVLQYGSELADEADAQEK